MRVGPRILAEPVVGPEVLAEARSRGQLAVGDPAVESSPPRPVFVLGPLRSGASLLALSLGQHPNLFQVLETNWFERFGIGLQQAFGDGLLNRNRAQLDVDGIEIEDFFAHFGKAIDRLMLRSVAVGSTDQPTRWIDGTPSNSFAVFVLLRLFPEARFIHVVRDVSEVVASLTERKRRRLYRSRFIGLTADEAYRHWLDTTGACLDAERAFGSALVMRVRRDDLIATPELTLRHCLDFLGESFDPACLRPFSSVTPGDQTLIDRAALMGSQATHRKARDDAEALNYLIFAETPSLSASRVAEATEPYPADLARIMAMEAAFSERCRRGERAVPSTLPGFGSRRTGGLPSWLSLRGMINREPRSR
jgi:hypothetical protein